MTDEQIKQNANKYAIKICEETPIDYSVVSDAYTAGAHSRDEEIRELLEKYTYKIDSLIAQKEDLQAECDQLRNPWISVEYRLPESQQECELYDHAGYLRHGFYMAHKKKWIGTPLGCDIPEYVDITHWRYTEPPKLK